VVDYTYDDEDRILSETESSGRSERWTYDARGRVVESVDSSGLATKYKYDERDRVIEEEDPLSILWNGLGRRGEAGRSREVIGPNGARGAPRVCRGAVGTGDFHLLHGGGKAVRCDHPLRTNLAIRVRPRESVSRDRNARGEQTTLGYDVLGRLATLSRAGVVQYGYKGPRSMWLEKGSDYRFEEENHPDGSVSRRKYEPAGMELKRPLDSMGRPGGIELNDLRVIPP
jgi:YD repeat-containing protein